jgi:hypothetical protein
MDFIHNLKIGILAIATVVSSWAGVVPQTAQAPTEADTFGAYNVSGGGTYRLKASLGVSDATISLSSFKEPISNTPYTMAYINTSIAYGTVDPQTSRSEFISFTGITQNTDGSARLTGVTRGLTRTPAGSACTASTTLAQRHPGQAIFILSDSPCHFAEYTVRRNDETITGQWDFPYPSASTSVATKGYVDQVAFGTTTIDRLITSGVAGETVVAGNIVYFSNSDARWYKTDTSTSTTLFQTLLGIAQGAGSSGSSIGGGVLLRGLDENQTSLVAGSIYYASTTPGKISSATSTEFNKILGQAKNSTSLQFDPSFIADDPSLTYLYGNGKHGDATITGTVTLTQNMYYRNLVVQNGAIVNTGGYAIYANLSITNAGTIRNNGTVGTVGGDGGPTSSDGGPAGPGGAGASGGYFSAGKNGSNGGAGAACPSGNGNGTAGTAGVAQSPSAVGADGARGGTGGTSTGGTGGAGGTYGTASTTLENVLASYLPNYPVTSGSEFSIISGIGVVGTSTGKTLSPSAGSGGGGGGGCATGQYGGGGGGAGGSGGVVFLAAPQIVNTGTISANGANGGAGGSGFAGGGGGGAGSGGIVAMIYRVLSDTGTTQASGGTGGAAGSGASPQAGTNGNAGKVFKLKIE